MQCENVNATDYNDTLVGDDNDNILWGWAGYDWFVPKGGNDTIYGGADIDTVAYIDQLSSVYVNLTGNYAYVDGANKYDNLYDIENIQDTIYDDVLIGTIGDNIFYISDGNDTLYSLGGNDFVSYEFRTGGVSVYLNESKTYK